MKNFIKVAVLLCLGVTARAGDIVSKGNDGGIYVSTGSFDSLCVNNASGGYGTCGTIKAGQSTGFNVGIGKQNPATALDVNGTITATAFTGPFSGTETFFSSVTILGAGGLGVTYGISGGSLAVAGSTLTVSNTGIINAPSQPRAQLQWSGSQNLNSGVATQVFWSTIVKNVQSMFIATSSGVVTVPIGGAGSYHVDANFAFTNSLTGTYAELDINVNGTRVCTGITPWTASSSGNSEVAIQTSCDMELSDSDAVSVKLTTDSGAHTLASDLQTDRFNIRKY